MGSLRLSRRRMDSGSSISSKLSSGLRTFWEDTKRERERERERERKKERDVMGGGGGEI